MAKKSKAEAAQMVAEAKDKALPRTTLADLSEDWRAKHAEVLARPEVVAALEAHLAHYTHGDCPGCATTSGAFRWGIAHGHGSCIYCGWPVRVYHYIPDPSPGPGAACRNCQAPFSAHVELSCPENRAEFRAPDVLRFDGVLYAHPDEVGHR